MLQLCPYLHFNGNCREAMEFYKLCLGGDLNLMTVGESPMAAQMPPAMKSKIMHSVLNSPGIMIMASDMMEGQAGKGNTVSLSITGATRKEIEPYFQKLSKGGKVAHALKEEFFGTYGDFTDKFGVDWMLEADLPKP